MVCRPEGRMPKWNPQKFPPFWINKPAASLSISHAVNSRSYEPIVQSRKQVSKWFTGNFEFWRTVYWGYSKFVAHLFHENRSCVQEIGAIVFKDIILENRRAELIFPKFPNFLLTIVSQCYYWAFDLCMCSGIQDMAPVSTQFIMDELYNACVK